MAPSAERSRLVPDEAPRTGGAGRAVPDGRCQTPRYRTGGAGRAVPDTSLRTGGARHLVTGHLVTGRVPPAGAVSGAPGERPCSSDTADGRSHRGGEASVTRSAASSTRLRIAPGEAGPAVDLSGRAARARLPTMGPTHLRGPRTGGAPRRPRGSRHCRAPRRLGHLLGPASQLGSPLHRVRRAGARPKPPSTVRQRLHVGRPARRLVAAGRSASMPRIASSIRSSRGLAARARLPGRREASTKCHARGGRGPLGATGPLDREAGPAEQAFGAAGVGAPVRAEIVIDSGRSRLSEPRFERRGKREHEETSH